MEGVTAPQQPQPRGNPLRLERRSSADRRAVFVGAKAYREADGSIIRDLFDAEGVGFFADAELLNRLARDKLQRHADKVATLGSGRT